MLSSAFENEKKKNNKKHLIYATDRICGVQSLKKLQFLQMNLLGELKEKENIYLQEN